MLYLLSDKEIKAQRNEVICLISLHCHLISLLSKVTAGQTIPYNWEARALSFILHILSMGHFQPHLKVKRLRPRDQITLQSHRGLVDKQQVVHSSQLLPPTRKP